MTYRPNPKYATKDAHAGAWTTCDRCGLIDNLSRMQFQFDFLGGSVPQNTGFLVCTRCLDDLNFQRKLIIIPPDPPPVYNTRPEPYVVDETNWLTVDDGSILSTESDVEFITSNPNPADQAATAQLITRLAFPGGTLTSVFLDLFDGDPTADGVSVLVQITGSANRIDVSGSLTTANGIAENTDVLSIASNVAAPVNVSFAAIYDAVSGGALLTSGPLGSAPTIMAGFSVQFDALALSINLNT